MPVNTWIVEALGFGLIQYAHCKARRFSPTAALANSEEVATNAQSLPFIGTSQLAFPGLPGRRSLGIAKTMLLKLQQAFNQGNICQAKRLFGSKLIAIKCGRQRITEGSAMAARRDTHGNVGGFLIGRDDDANAAVERPSIKQAHTDDNIAWGGSLHTLIHQPDAAVPVQQILEPEPSRRMAFGNTKDGEPRIRHRLGQSAISRIQRMSVLLEKLVIGTPAALVRFKQGNIGDHLRYFIFG